LAIAGKLQQELLAVAAVGDVPRGAEGGDDWRAASVFLGGAISRSKSAL